MKKSITYGMIKDLDPCYDPVKYIPKTWKGTVSNILRLKTVPAPDRLWVCVRRRFLTDKQLNLYGLGCARLVEKYSTDPRVKDCNDTVERYLNGKATRNALHTVLCEARRAVCNAASRAARAAAYSAMYSAYSAYGAYGAEDGAYDTEDDVYNAACSAAVWSVAAHPTSILTYIAAKEKQCKLLLKIIKETT